MRNFLLLMRVQLMALAHSLSPRSRAARHRVAGVLIGVSYAVLALICIGYLILTGIMLVSMGLGPAVPAFAVMMGSLAGVVFTFLKANGTLFGLKDFDLVMALPIPRRTVVAARVAALYTSAASLGAVFALPLWGVYLALVNASAWTVACCVASLLLAPAAPTALATFLAFGVAALSSRFRHANIAYIVFALAAFAAVFVGAYAFSLSAQASGHEAAMQQLEGGLAAVNGAIGAVWPPAQWVALSCAGGSPMALLGFIAVSVAVPALALEIMQRFYLSINAALAAGGRGRALTAGELHARSGQGSAPFKALVLKEYRTLIGVPSYAFNCLFGYLLMLIIAVAVGVMGIEGILLSGVVDGVEVDATSIEGVVAIVSNVLPWLFVFCGIASPSAACSISMEGKAAWIFATAPLPRRTILGAKLAANALPVAATLAVSTVILVACGRVDALGAFSVLLTGFGAFYLMVNIGLSIDARQPNFSWSSPNEVVKRSAPINVTVIGGMVLTFAGIGAALALSFTFGPLAGAAFNLAVGAVTLAAGHLVFCRTCRTAQLYIAP